ncbi:hypothetical protein GCM10027259_27240 [Micromonospora palomenae]
MSDIHRPYGRAAPLATVTIGRWNGPAGNMAAGPARRRRCTALRASAAALVRTYGGGPPGSLRTARDGVVRQVS